MTDTIYAVIEDIYAVIEDITPTRATVIAVGPDAEDLRAEHEHRHDVQVVEVDATTTVGERVWLSSTRPA